MKQNSKKIKGKTNAIYFVVCNTHDTIPYERICFRVKTTIATKVATVRKATDSHSFAPTELQ